MKRLVIAALVAISSPAFADNPANVLGGPVLGVTWGHGHPASLLVGVEAGAGIGPERVNLGFEYGADRSFGYLELDPWFLVGGSFGFGIDQNLDPHPVLGAWEAVPLVQVCSDANTGFHFMATVSIGFRYTGMFEAYVAPKLGAGGDVCISDE